MSRIFGQTAAHISATPVPARDGREPYVSILLSCNNADMQESFTPEQARLVAKKKSDAADAAEGRGK